MGEWGGARLLSCGGAARVQKKREREGPAWSRQGKVLQAVLVGVRI